MNRQFAQLGLWAEGEHGQADKADIKGSEQKTGRAKIRNDGAGCPGLHGKQPSRTDSLGEALGIALREAARYSGER